MFTDCLSVGVVFTWLLPLQLPGFVPSPAPTLGRSQVLPELTGTTLSLPELDLHHEKCCHRCAKNPPHRSMGSLIPPLYFSLGMGRGAVAYSCLHRKPLHCLDTTCLSCLPAPSFRSHFFLPEDQPDSPGSQPHVTAQLANWPQCGTGRGRGSAGSC